MARPKKHFIKKRGMWLVFADRATYLRFLEDVKNNNIACSPNGPKLAYPNKLNLPPRKYL